MVRDRKSNKQHAKTLFNLGTMRSHLFKLPIFQGNRLFRSLFFYLVKNYSATAASRGNLEITPLLTSTNDPVKFIESVFTILVSIDSIGYFETIQD